MAKLGLKQNLLRQASTQYQGYDFDSMAKISEAPVGINENGIYELFTSGKDEGQNIDARVDLPAMNLGTSMNKHLRSAFLGVRADGTLLVTAVDDEYNETTYTAIPRKLGVHQSIKVPMDRNRNKGCYYTIKVENQNGADFDLDTITVLPIFTARRKGHF